MTPAAPAAVIFSALGLRKHFRQKGGFARPAAAIRAVEDVSFVVGTGETLGVVGESGCGKSTLARLMLQLIPADAGEMAFNGHRIGSSALAMRQFRRQAQMVFQDSHASLNPRLTIEDSVAFGPIVHGATRTAARQAARQVLGDVGLAADNFASRYPHELSGGQRQRVNIARALVLGPRLVVFDEAVSALDKSIESQVLALIRDLKTRHGLTYVFISHDLNVVQHVSDRVLVMYLGKIVEIGPARDIYATPRHPYTRALLASRLSMDPERRTTIVPLAGDPPNPIDPPSGCRFRTRCPLVIDVCARVEPPLARLGPDTPHEVACHAISKPAASGEATRAGH